MLLCLVVFDVCLVSDHFKLCHQLPYAFVDNYFCWSLRTFLRNEILVKLVSKYNEWRRLNTFKKIAHPRIVRVVTVLTSIKPEITGHNSSHAGNVCASDTYFAGHIAGFNLKYVFQITV